MRWKGEIVMGRDNYYDETLEKYYDQKADEAESEKKVMNTLMEAVENQLNNHNPDFVTEVFLSLQGKGCNRKQARTVIASVFADEVNDILKDGRSYDEASYKSALKRKNRTITDAKSVPNVALAIEDEINEICREIWDAIEEGEVAEAVVSFLEIWPILKEYVIHNLYRDTAVGIVKPDVTDISEMTEYYMDFDSLFPEMGSFMCDENQNESAITFCKEILELFSWKYSKPDSYKDDIGYALLGMEKWDEADAWYQRWLEEEPDNATCMSGIAYCHQAKGDIEGALAIVETYLPVRDDVDLKYRALYLRAFNLYNIVGNTKKANHYKSLVEECCRTNDNDLFIDEMISDLDTIVKKKKIYPNDPCPCGSGKKYKKCCGKG